MTTTKPRVVEGIQWPLVPNSKKEGDRSTTYSNKAVFKAALGSLASEEATSVENEQKWRKNYDKYLLRHVKSSIEKKEGAIKSAEAGLDWMHNNFEFVRNGEALPLKLAMSNFSSTFKTFTIKGNKPKPTSIPELEVPYKGGMLKRSKLVAQISYWMKYGTIEPSAGNAILNVLRNEDYRDLSGKYFVLLGATSAMGPLRFLLNLGANIVAIDLDRPHIWSNLISLARDSCGTLTFPVSSDPSNLTSDDVIAGAAGCNLLTQAPEILDWLKSVHKGETLVVGAYAYLDGELHVRVSLAMDAIIKGLIEDKSSHPSIIPAYLCTPTDIHVRSLEAKCASQKNYSIFSSFFTALVRLTPLCLIGPLEPNFGPKYTVRGKGSLGFDVDYYLVDGIINRQGPNYALAKRLQHWRAIVSRVRHNCVVSANIAPSTSTASVTSNKLFSMAYGGMHWFKPMEVFMQDTSNAVMGALLLHDIHNSKAVGASPEIDLPNPLLLFSNGSFHGGVWRLGFKMDSIGGVSIIMYVVIRIFKAAFLSGALYFLYKAISKNTSPDY